MPNSAQTKENHARFDPVFHFVLSPLCLILLIGTVVNVVKHPDLEAIFLLLFAIALLLIAIKARTYALRVQDRLIRLEERLRMQALLPLPLQQRTPEFTEKQFVALRFASDAELPRLCERTLNEKLTPKQIKEAIEQWKPDDFRV